MKNQEPIAPYSYIVTRFWKIRGLSSSYSYAYQKSARNTQWLVWWNTAQTNTNRTNSCACARRFSWCWHAANHSCNNAGYSTWFNSFWNWPSLDWIIFNLTETLNLRVDRLIHSQKIKSYHEVFVSNLFILLLISSSEINWWSNSNK